MLGQRQGGFRLQVSQEIVHLLFEHLIACLLVSDRICQRELKAVIQLDRVPGNSRFLFSFPQRSFFERFAGFAMALGQIPTIRVLHQQEFGSSLLLGHQQDSRRSDSLPLSLLGRHNDLCLTAAASSNRILI